MSSDGLELELPSKLPRNRINCSLGSLRNKMLGNRGSFVLSSPFSLSAAGSFFQLLVADVTLTPINPFAYCLPFG